MASGYRLLRVTSTSPKVLFTPANNLGNVSFIVRFSHTQAANRLLFSLLCHLHQDGLPCGWDKCVHPHAQSGPACQTDCARLSADILQGLLHRT